jgi:hypothetical protein
MKISRRAFANGHCCLAGAAIRLDAQGKKNLKIGHTGITWPSGNIGGRGGAPQAATPTSATVRWAREKCMFPRF